jgi:hypothetical protein
VIQKTEATPARGKPGGDVIEPEFSDADEKIGAVELMKKPRKRARKRRAKPRKIRE